MKINWKRVAKGFATAGTIGAHIGVLLVRCQGGRIRYRENS